MKANLIMNDSICNAQIKNVVQQLSSIKLSDSQIRCLSDNLHDIYANNPDFRHEYSSISSVLVNAMQNEDRADASDTKESNAKTLPINTILEANLSALKRDFQRRYPYIEGNDISKSISKQFNKLYDHIMLETVRLNYMTDIKSDLKASEKFKKEFLNTEVQVKKIEDDVSTAKSGYIAQVISVLSIFAAIVITFSGGLTLLGSGFSAIQASKSPFRLLFMFGLFGFIMYNAIIGLMFIVCRMNHKDIGVACKTGFYCYGCPNNKSSLWGILCQAIHKYPHILVVEFIFIYFMYLVFICWSFTTSNKEIFPQVLHQGNYFFEVLLILMPFVAMCLVYYRRIIRDFFKKNSKKRKSKNRQ